MPSFTNTFGPLSPTLHGAVVSSILLPGALAALVAGIQADRHGRTALITAGALTYAAGAAIECSAPRLGVFVAGRLIKGAGDGLFLSAVYVQVSETSPARRRGALTSLPQFAIVIGLVTGFFVCYGTSSRLGAGSSAAWRLPLGLGAGLALAFAAMMRAVPPSPRWLLAKGRVDEARDVLRRLGIDEAESAALLSADPALAQAANRSFGRGVRDMVAEFRRAFAAPYRGRTLLGCAIMAGQQFSGIDGVLYYAPILLGQAGLSSDQAAFLASGVSGLVILATTIPAALLADRWGRRTSSLWGGTLITALMLLMGSLYAAGEVRAHDGAGRWVVVVCIYLFAIVFSATWAIGFRAFLVESLPGKTRSSASSLAQSSNWVRWDPPFPPLLPSPHLLCALFVSC